MPELTKGEVFHEHVELPGGVEVADGHVPEDLAAGKFRKVCAVDVSNLRRPQESDRTIDDLFDVGLRRYIGEYLFRVDRVAEKDHVVSPITVAVPTSR